MSETNRELCPEETAMQAAGADAEALNEKAPAETEAPAPEAAPETVSEPAPECAAPMRWHGFLVKCMLWLAAVWHLLQAGLLLSGAAYYGAAARDSIYGGMPAMRWLDYGFCALLVLVSVLQLSARAKLAKRSRAGIKQLRTAYILLTLSVAGYGVARWLITGLAAVSLPLIAQTAAYFCLLMVNTSYYRKREAAFSAEGRR